MSLNILFVSLAAPPQNTPEALQVGKVIQGLSKERYKIHLITEINDFSGSWENSVNSGLSIGNALRHDINVYSLWVERIQRRLGFSFFPDDKFFFIEKILRMVQNKKISFDIIYSRSAPISSSIAAYKVACKYKKPWIMHLSDPWTINPYYRQSNKDLKWERKCFEKAAYITLTNKQLIERYSNIYPELRDKFIHFPNVYNEESEELYNQATSEYFKIIYTGNLYGNRNPSSFLKGFTIFLSGLSDGERKKIKLILIGNIEEKIRKQIRKFRFQDSIEIREAIPFDQIKVVQKEADILLAMDARFEMSEEILFFPSKILDYMVARRPILLISNKNSPAFTFVNGRYGSAIEHDDTPKIANFLKDLFTRKSRGEELFPLKEPDKKYSVKYNIPHLAELFERALN